MEIPKAMISLNYPVQTILIRKVGASFLRNLFYLFDHFELAQRNIHLEKGEGLQFEEPLPRISPLDDIRFVFFRNPLDRFVAFYYDQLFNIGPNSLTQLRKKLEKYGFKRGDIKDNDLHRRNLMVLVEYVETVSQKRGFLNINEMLAPQYKDLLPAIDRGFEPLDLLRANFELEMILKSEIPNIKALISRASRRSAPFEVYNTPEIVTSSVAARHKKLYEADFEFYWARKHGKA